MKTNDLPNITRKSKVATWAEAVSLPFLCPQGQAQCLAFTDR